MLARMFLLLALALPLAACGGSSPINGEDTAGNVDVDTTAEGVDSDMVID